MKLLQKYLWIIISANHYVDIDTFSYTRKGAIKNWITGTTKDWKYYESLGCKVIKVSIDLKEL